MPRHFAAAASLELYDRPQQQPGAMAANAQGARISAKALDAGQRLPGSTVKRCAVHQSPDGEVGADVTGSRAGRPDRICG